MAKTRDELSEAAIAVLKALDAVRSQVEFSHEDMIVVVAAALAQMSEEDRDRFRAAFDQIEEEMHAPKPNDGSRRLS